MIFRLRTLSLLAAMMMPLSSSAQPVKSQTTDTKIIFLGTAGGAEVRLKRIQSTTAIVVNDSVYLIDVADGALRQMAKAGLPQTKVKAIFFTLFSQDHISGLPNFLSTRWLTSKKPPLAIFGPVGLTQTLEGIDTSLKPVAASSFVMSRDPLGGIQAKELLDSGPIFSDENIKVSVLALPRTPGRPAVAFAYRFETPGGSIVFTGATGMRDSLIEFAKGATILVSEDYDINAILKKTASPEATPELRERVMRHMRTNHLDPDQIGTLATAAGVKRVVLHRLEPVSDSETKSAIDRGYAAGVRSKYTGPVILPEDLQSVALASKR